jgi:hypothetical protein
VDVGDGAVGVAEAGVFPSSSLWVAGDGADDRAAGGAGAEAGSAAVEEDLAGSGAEADSAVVEEARAGDDMATMTLDDLVAQLLKAYGDELTAVVLYGSAAAGEHFAKRSDYNVLVIVRGLSLDRLRAEAAVARAWRGAGNPPPLTLTDEEWRRSADIFPMEYADILERHRVLHGTPPFDGITVDREHLRLQVEHEAMGSLIQFRQGILAAGGDGKAQIQLLEDSLSTLMVIFRAVLRLHGEAPPTDYLALASAVGARSGMDPAAFRQVIEHVRGATRLSASAVGDVLAGYLTGLQQLVGYLDRFAGKRPAAPR